MQTKHILIALIALFMVACSVSESEPENLINVSYPIKLAENNGCYVYITAKGEAPAIYMTVERKPSDQLMSFTWSINGDIEKPHNHKETLAKTWDTDEIVSSCKDVFEATFINKGNITVSLNTEYRSGKTYTQTLIYHNNGNY